jgi:hypothetical protein
MILTLVPGLYSTLILIILGKDGDVALETAPHLDSTVGKPAPVQGWAVLYFHL